MAVRVLTAFRKCGINRRGISLYTGSRIFRSEGPVDFQSVRQPVGLDTVQLFLVLGAS